MKGSLWTRMPDYVGPPDEVDLPAAYQLMEEAWALVADAFARHQVVEYDRAITSQRPRPLGRWHPWIPGLHWHRQHRAVRGRRTAPPVEVIRVVRDMQALKRVPDVLPAHALKVAHRIKREGEHALWEARVAAQYAASNIRAEWAAVSWGSEGAPDVWLREFNAEIQVKCLDPRDDAVNDPAHVLKRVDAARRQLRGDGPGAIVIAISGATSLAPWAEDSVFRAYMSQMLQMEEYALVSACVFVTEPVIKPLERGRYQFYGNPAWWVVFEGAKYAWPTRLPLVTDRAES